MSELPEHVAENRRYWDECAHEWVAPGERHFRQSEPTWGIWGIPESELRLLPEDLTGKDAIELGCGTGYVSCWLSRRGARVVGIDNSEQQLSTARRLSEQHGVPIELVHGNAESVPRPDASFDFAISEYGAALWCDPHAWIPEAHRLLRPGGELVFLTLSPLLHTCMPLSGDAGEALLRSTLDLHVVDYRNAPDPGGVEFNLPTSGWFALFARTGFVVERFLELRAPADAEDTRFGIRAAWGRAHPAEQVWVLRKR